MIKDRTQFFQLIRFGIVGIINSSISFLAYFLLLRLGIYYLISSGIAYLLGIVSGYFLSSKYVFKQQRNTRNAFWFFLIYLSSLLINFMLLYFLVQNLGISKIIGQLCVMGVIFLYNFYLNKGVTFRQMKTGVSNKKADPDLESTFFCAIISLALGSAYWLARLGFDNNSPIKMLVVIGTALLPISFPEIIARIKQRLLINDYWYNSRSASLLFVLAGMVLLGIFSINLNLSYIVSILGFAGLIYLFFDSFLKKTNKNIGLIILFGSIFSLWAIAVAWGSNYHDPLFLEKIATGYARLDTLFHADVANMIKTYNVPSTGLSGIPYLNYHFASHIIFAQLSRLVRLNMIDFYNLAYPVIFIPLFLKAFLTAIGEVRKLKKINQSLNVTFWIILLIGFTGLLPSMLLGKLGFSTATIFISESYLISLILTFAAFGIVSSYVMTSARMKKTGERLFFLVFLPVMLGAIGFAKISLLYLILIVVLYLFLKFKLYRKVVYVGSLAISVVVFLATFKLANLSGESPILFLAYIKTYVYPDLAFLFFLTFYFWAAFYLYLKFKSYTLNEIRELFKKNQIVDSEILIIFVVAGFLPGAILAIGGGSAGYFMEPQRWLALSLFLIEMPLFWEGKGFLKNFSLREIRFTTAMLAVIILPLLVFSFGNIFAGLKQFVINNEQIRMAVLPKNDQMKNLGFLSYTKALVQEQNVPLSQALYMATNHTQKNLDEQKNINFILVKFLKDLGDNVSTTQKHKTLIFIPQTNAIYWNMSQYKISQFVAPALTGMAMINGIQPFAPKEIDERMMLTTTEEFNKIDIKIFTNAYLKTSSPDSTIKNPKFLYKLKDNLSREEKVKIYDLIAPSYYKLLKDYGFDRYEIGESENDYFQKTTDGQLCYGALTKGFERIIEVDEGANNLPTSRVIECKRLN